MKFLRGDSSKPSVALDTLRPNKLTIVSTILGGWWGDR